MNLANPVWQREPFHGPRIEEPELVANEVDCWCRLVFQSGLAKKIQKVHQLAGHESLQLEVLQIKTLINIPSRT
jgi:hypothetical protein